MSSCRPGTSRPRDIENVLYDSDDMEEANEVVDDDGAASFYSESDSDGGEDGNNDELGMNEVKMEPQTPSRSRSRSPLRPFSRQESSTRGSSPIAPPYSPLSQYGETPSPIIVSEVGTDLSGADIDEGDSPHVHQLIPPVESASRSSPTCAARGGQRSVRGGRARGRGRVGPRRSGRGIRGARTASTAAHTWSTGDPVVQVCVTDEDVPAPLREMSNVIVAARIARRLRYEDDEEEFDKAEDNADADLLGWRNSFEWRPMDSFRPQKETFQPPRTGSIKSHNNIYDAFRSFWPDSILQDIVRETNRYASVITSPNFRKDWFETNIHELLMLFGFWMMLGIIKMPTIKSCFATNKLLSTDVFKAMFSQRRYASLTRALHFANNSKRPPNASRLYCFGRILDHLNKVFKSNYVPGPNVSIDESLTLWKGVLQFRQYIRTKAARFGIKTFELCDSTTGYLWSFIVHTGKGSNVRSTQSMLKSTSVVLDLIRPLLHKGYSLYMDNWFNSPTLARYLKSKGTDCVGTLRASRYGVPALLQQADLQRGQLIARHCGDMVVQAWQDKKKVMTISTYHDATVESISNGRVTQFKPKVILDYNKYMGGVDRKDQMLEPYLIERKRGKKWYMKLFKRLLNASILNARILLESSSGRHQDHLACRLRLVESIMEKHLHLTPIRRYSSHSGETLARIDTRHVHWPVRIPPSGTTSDEGRRTRIRCVYCVQNGKKNSKTAYKCEFCDKPLCIDTCFKLYHNA